MTAYRLLVPWAIVALGIGGAAPAAGGDAVPTHAPLTNEDIVRMVASGTPERDVLEAIRTHEEAFDLAPDMVVELKLAGVSPAIVAAMQQKRAESAPAAAAVEGPARGQVRVVVSLRGGTLRVPAWADEDAKAKLQLPKENDQREVKDLAVFLGCVSAEHVPDLWRSKSPLGRDMSFVARHRMLAFVAGDTPAGKTPRLTLPATLEAEVDESEPHDLVLGVAARIGDRWIQLGAAVLRKTTITPGQKPLVGRVEHVGHGFDVKVTLSAPR
jgi:hypothetical protein